MATPQLRDRTYFWNGQWYTRDQLQDFLAPGESVDDMINFIDQGYQGYELPRDPNTGETIPYEGKPPEWQPIPMSSLQGGEGADTLAGGKRTLAGTAKARGLSTVDPRLVQIIDAAAARSPYDVQIFSGQRAGSKGGSRHNTGNALDIALIDPTTGEVIPNYKSSTGFPIYAEFAKVAREEQMRLAPDMADQFRWGGGFSDKDFDLMHFDFKPGGAMAYWTWKDGGKLTAAGAEAVPKFGPGYIYANGERAKAPPGQYASLWGREPLQEQADPAVASIQTALAQNGLYDGPVNGVMSPQTSAAIERYNAQVAGLDAPASSPQEVAALALDGMDAPAPAQQAIDDMLTGQSAEQVLAGGPRSNPRRDAPATGPIAPDTGSFARTVADVLDEGPNLDPRRVAPATGPVPASMGAMVSADDVLAAGPRLRPGGAPDAASVPDPAISPMRPAVGGPNDRRPQPPTPPPRAQGIPDPRMRPDPASLPQRGFPAAYGEQPQPDVMTDDRRQRILADLLELEQRDPPAPALAGDLSAAMGGPPSRTGDLSAAMGDAPSPTNLTPASQPISTDPSFGVGYRVQRDADRMAAEQDARMAQFDRDMQADRVIAAADYYQPQNIMQPPSQPPPPRALQEARTKDDAYSLPPDFSIASEPAPIITAGPPPSAMGPIGNTISPDNDRGAGRQPFVDANRTPVSGDRTEPAWLDLPDPTPPGLQSPPVADWRDQFNLSFSPGGPGMIADLTPPKAPSPSVPPPPSNPFDALMGPGAAMGAMPFNEASQGVGAPDFSNASDASWWNGAPTGDLGLESIPPKTAAMADALYEAPPNPGETLADQALAQAYASPGASRFIDYGLKTPYTQAAENVYQPAGPAGGMDIRSPAAQTLSDEAPPPASSSAPMFSQPPAPAGGRLGPVPGSGPFGALFGGAGGGLMGKIGANWAGPQWTGAVTQGSGPYMYDGGMGTNNWWSGNTNAMGGSTGLSWTGSDGRTITAYLNDGGQTYTHGYGPGV